MTPTASRRASAARRVAAWRERGTSLSRLVFTRHLGITSLVLVGLGLRIAVMVGYRPALWFHGDSGVYIRQSRRLLPPIDPFRPAGYTLFLKLFQPTGTLTSVVALQHLLGLAMVVAVYAFLRRRGLPRWLACLGAVPLLFDSLQVTLEHFILAETLFTALLLAGLLALLWTRVPTTAACFAAGGLLFLAWFTKPLALPLVVIALVYLLGRRVGWPRVAAFAATFVVPYLLVQIAVSGHASVYGANSTALYGRAASVADCDRLTLTAAERDLCPGPGQHGMRPDWYIWADDAPGAAGRSDPSAYPAMRGFALAVVRAQPVDLARQIGRETAAHFVPGVDLGWSFGCLRERMSLPDTTRDTQPLALQCHPQLASAAFSDVARPYQTSPPATALTTALHGYSVAGRTSPLVVSLATLLTLLAVLARRRGQGSAARDAALLMVAGLSLIVAPVVVGMYDARYALPALPLVSLAAALSLHRLCQPRPARRSAWTDAAASVGDGVG